MPLENPAALPAYVIVPRDVLALVARVYLPAAERIRNPDPVIKAAVAAIETALAVRGPPRSAADHAAELAEALVRYRAAVDASTAWADSLASGATLKALTHADMAASRALGRLAVTGRAGLPDGLHL